VGFSCTLFAGCKGGEVSGEPPEGGSGSSSGGTSSSSGVTTSSSGGSGSSSGVTSSSSSGGASDSCENPAVQCVVPPPPPAGGAPTAASHNYAFHTLYVGDTDRTGITSASAWKGYGYNLDDKVTTKLSTDVCTLAAGAAKTTQADGNGGIDNSFGENILPILVTVSGSDFAAKINTSIQEGQSTLMTYVTGFDDSAGNSTSASGLGGVFLYGGMVPGVPTWNTTTHWPILPTAINGCTPTAGCPAGTDPVKNAQIRFPTAYQAAGTFVSGALMDVDLSFGSASLINVPIRSAVISFSPKAPGAVTDGTVAGVMVTSEYIAALQAEAGRISTSLCSGSAFQSIAQQIEQASDIVYDPNSGVVSNEAGTSCNAISIGLGFEATEIAAPTAADITAPQVPAPDPCGD
jgi:hypothetical protein